MKPDDHINKSKSMERTLHKLDEVTDYETIVELCMLISAHNVNAALHSLNVTPIDRDIKHNKLSGEIKRRRVRELIRICDAIDSLEGLRPRHVYGKGGDGDVAKNALKILKEVLKTCEEVLKS